jgi:hypothetical protein
VAHRLGTTALQEADGLFSSSEPVSTTHISKVNREEKIVIKM